MTEPCMFTPPREPFYCRIHADVRLRLTDERCRRAVAGADLAGLLHAAVIDTGWGACVHSPEGEWSSFCEEAAARLHAAGVGLSTHHTITPECGPICWTTGHHHSPECDGCRRLIDMGRKSGLADAATPEDPR